VLVTLKGLPSTYDKDLQEDKLPLFNAYDTLTSLLPVLAGALRSLRVRPERMREAIDSTMLATDLADYLVEKGLPFRQAHALAGQAVQLSIKQGKPLEALTLEEFQSLTAGFGQLTIDAQIYTVFDPALSTARRSAFGGTAPQAVRQQITLAKQAV
jgi:argininosuccinate lyase